jgi:hypothetical protein
MAKKHFFVCASVLLLTLAYGVAAPPALAGTHEQSAEARVDWNRFRIAFTKYVNYPASQNARAVTSLLPLESVAVVHSAAEDSATEVIYDGLPMLSRQVEARDRDAVRLAFALFSVTDGGAASEDLDIMLGKLIRIDPKLFLAELSTYNNRVPETLLVRYPNWRMDGLLGNCGEEYVDLFNANCLELNRRAQALRSVTDPTLSNIKAICLAELNRQVKSECR